MVRACAGFPELPQARVLFEETEVGDFAWSGRSRPRLGMAVIGDSLDRKQGCADAPRGILSKKPDVEGLGWQAPLAHR